jgi:hypothetical protein
LSAVINGQEAFARGCRERARGDEGDHGGDDDDPPVAHGEDEHLPVAPFDRPVEDVHQFLENGLPVVSGLLFLQPLRRQHRGEGEGDEERNRDAHAHRHAEAGEESSGNTGDEGDGEEDCDE